MWKTIALVVAVVLLIVIDSSDFTEAGPRGKGKGKGGEVRDPNCSNWTLGPCVFKDGKSCGRGSKQGTRTGDSCPVKSKQFPCNVPCKKTKCMYNKGDWQPCVNGQMTRALTLKPGQPNTCEASKTLTKKCKTKAPKAGKPKCKYAKNAQWSACTNGKMTRTVTLKGRKPGCEPTKVETKDCK